MKELNENELRNRLERAEALLSPPEETSDLAGRVRGRARRQAGRWRTIRIVAAAVLLLAVGLSIWGGRLIVRPGGEAKAVIANRQSRDEAAAFVQPDSLQPEETVVAEAAEDSREAELARLRNEIAQLRQELEGRVRIVEAMVRRQEQDRQLARWQAQAAGTELAVIQETMQAEVIAGQLFEQARRYETSDTMKPAANRQYRQVAGLYPETTWGRLAREKLNELEIKQGI